MPDRAELETARAEVADWHEAAGQGGLPRHQTAPVLALDGFDGPLDFLLDMVRRHRVDLSKLSLVSLTNQFVAALDAAAIVPLERRGDWLVMAATLLWLKAKLMWPPTPAAAEQADADSQRRLRQFAQMARLQDAAAWLAARDQLGLDVFARGRSDRVPIPRAPALVAFLEATLVMLEGRLAPEEEAVLAYQPVIPILWRPVDAIARIRHLLAAATERTPMVMFLPRLAAERPDCDLTSRAAVASTLIAGLELVREGTLAVDQPQPFAAITFAAP